MNITLYGAASDHIDSAYKEAVYALGAEMARRGHTMVYGGGASGLMGAAANESWDDDYCLAYLKLTGSNPLSVKSWTKSSAPTSENNIYIGLSWY